MAAARAILKQIKESHMSHRWLRPTAVLGVALLLVVASATRVQADAPVGGTKDETSKAQKPAAASPLAESRRLVDRPDERVSILENGLTLILKAHRTAPVVCV